MNIEKQVNSFHQDGFVKLPGLIDPQELKTLQADTQKIVDSSFEGIEDEIDYFADLDPETGQTIFHRDQYIFPKSSTSPNSLVCLLVHPEILTIVDALLGNQFLCEAEALVFKTPGTVGLYQSMLTVTRLIREHLTPIWLLMLIFIWMRLTLKMAA